MRVLIDANVPLDVWLKRKHHVPSGQVMEAVGNKRIQGYMTSSLTLFALTTCAKAFDENEYREPANGLLDIITVIGQDKEVLRAAVKDAKWADMEDSFQYHTALGFHQRIDAIITGNTEHYQPAEKHIRVVTPSDFVRSHLGNRNR